MTVGAGPTRPAGVRNQQICDLLDSSNVIFTRVNTQQGEFGEREFIPYLFFLDISAQGGKVHEVIPM